MVCWFCRWLYLGGEFLVVGLGLYLVCCSFVVICFVVVFAVCCWYWLMPMFRLIDFIWLLVIDGCLTYVDGG